MTDLFSPHRADGRAEWRVVYDEILKQPYGHQLLFEELETLLETHDRNRIHRAVSHCNRVLTRESVPRVLGNVRGIGYRILAPGEYTPQALNLQKQARKRMTSAVDLMRTAPTEDMTPAQRQWAHQVTMVLIDNDLRLKNQETWRKEAESRLKELEARAGIEPPTVINGEVA